MPQQRSPFRVTTPTFILSVSGMQQPFAALGKSVQKQACDIGAVPGKVCQIHPPAKAGQPGFQSIELPRYDCPVQAEGVWLDEPGSAATMQTRDCPTLLFWNQQTGRLVFTHAGRPAMTTPVDCGGCQYNVVTTAARAAIKNGNPRDVHLWIVGSICGHCFVHESDDSEQYIAPFDKFGPTAFTNRSRGALNLPAIITMQAQHYGIPPGQIHYDQWFCTKEHLAFASLRRGTTDRHNTVTVIRHQ